MTCYSFDNLLWQQNHLNFKHRQFLGHQIEVYGMFSLILQNIFYSLLAMMQYSMIRHMVQDFDISDLSHMNFVQPRLCLTQQKRSYSLVWKLVESD